MLILKLSWTGITHLFHRSCIINQKLDEASDQLGDKGKRHTRRWNPSRELKGPITAIPRQKTTALPGAVFRALTKEICSLWQRKARLSADVTITKTSVMVCGVSEMRLWQHQQITYGDDNKCNKRCVIATSNAVIHPLTMMVTSIYAIITRLAVDGTWCTIGFACRTIFDAGPIRQIMRQSVEGKK